MSHSYQIAVLIGRFQPFHLGHARLLEKALATAPRVIVILGSALAARNAKNPFSWEERAAMIRSTLPEELHARISFIPVRDHYDDVRWGQAVTHAVQNCSTSTDRIALIGYLKDASSHYLKRFPAWEFIGMPQQGEIDATPIRQIYFETEDRNACQALLQGLLPSAIAQYLQGWERLPYFANLRAEHLSIEANKKIWGTGPFITVDAIVEVAEHILLVKRGNTPGKGLWAVPGGFLEPRERVLQGAMRELKEETGFGLLDSSLEEALQAVTVFDHPDRSLRGRTITHAHYFKIESSRLPEVAGADDAAEARWVPIKALAAMEDQFFEDHFHILDHFLSLTA